jgi:hypothetical protein
VVITDEARSFVEPSVAPVPPGVDRLVGQAAGQWRAPLLNRIPMWALALAGYGLLSLGGLALAARRLATPASEER